MIITVEETSWESAKSVDQIVATHIYSNLSNISSIKLDSYKKQYEHIWFQRCAVKHFPLTNLLL